MTYKECLTLVFLFTSFGEKLFSRWICRALWWYSVLKCQSGRHVISDELGAMCIWSLERTVSCCPIGPPSTGEGKEKEPLEAAESPKQSSLYQPCSSFSVWAIMGQDFIYHLWSPYTMSCEREPLLQSQSDTTWGVRHFVIRFNSPESGAYYLFISIYYSQTINVWE